MQKQANTPKAKAAITPAKKEAKAQALANTIETLVKKEQRFLYRFQLLTPKLAPNKAKQMRQKLRRQLANFIFPMLLQKDAAKKAEATANFIAFYKEHFILNDFSLPSLSDSRDSEQAQSLKEMLAIAQASLAKK